MFEKEAEEYAIENWEYYEEGKNDSKALKQAYLAGAEFGYNKSKEELEEENAELKEQCSILADCNTCHSTCKNENIEMKEQLTKAKEIIKDFILIAKVEHLKDRYETVDEAEQFLNSEGE